MIKPNSTLIAVVLDRSGSMGGLAKEVIGGFDTFVVEQKKVPGDCKITLTQFDTEYETPWSLRDINDVPSIGTFYVPRGMTALNDAVAKTIQEVGAELGRRPEHERPATVIFVIITDGQENSSKEFKGAEGKAQVKKMIEHQTSKYGWKFTYIGANVDAFAEAKDYGIAPAAAMAFMSNSAGVDGSYKGLASSVVRSRAGASLHYTSQERNAAMGGDGHDTTFPTGGDDDEDPILGKLGVKGVDPSKQGVKSSRPRSTR
jgi:hypothetical protein